MREIQEGHRPSNPDAADFEELRAPDEPYLPPVVLVLMIQDQDVSILRDDW